MSIEWLCEAIQECELHKPRGYYLGHTLKSVKAIAWEMLRDLAPPGAKFNALDLSATFKDGGKVQLLGSWNWQTHRGVYADALVIDEVDLVPPSAFSAVFRPALSDRDGKALFIGTPQGKGHLYQRYMHAQQSDQWHSWHIPVTETNILPADEIADLKATMPKPDWLREFMVDFDAAAAGAFYAKEIEHAACGAAVPLIPDLPVTAAWHLGKTDSVVVTFWQETGHKLRCFDALWEQQTSMADLAELVRNKPFDVAQHIAPGDQVHRPGSRIATARAEGIKLKPTKPLETIERIYATKPVIRRCEFDQERCEDVIEALRQYRAEYDEVRRVYETTPVADWCQEFAGSVEAYATSHNPRRSDWSKPIVYPGDKRAA